MDQSGRFDRALPGGKTVSEDSEVRVISGTRRQIRELVDGSLEVRIHIDPQFKQDFHRLFPSIDMPCALAPLVPDFEKLSKYPEEEKKGGALCRLAGVWSKDEDFQEWLYTHYSDGIPVDEEEAAQWIRVMCKVVSRSYIDHDTEATERFQRLIRAPFMDWMKAKGK